MTRPNANTAWFTITMQQGNFSVYSFFGREEANKPYEFDVEVVSRSAREDIAALLGTGACLSITDRSGATRQVHGLIAAFEQLHTANTFTHYTCKIVPRLWFLDKIRDHLIFQNLSVPEIILKILKEQGFSDEQIRLNLFFSYTAREYCVQYGETDLQFITRLCEEEGIFFYFQHDTDKHALCFCDMEGGPAIAGESDVRFYPGSGHIQDTAVISRVRYKHRVNSNVAAYKEWNFQKTRLDLFVQDAENDAPGPPGMRMEQYRYPHLYELQATGSRYAALQRMRQFVFRTWLELESDVSRFLPGYTFSVREHPREDVNAEWWVAAVRHRGEQPEVLEHESPDDRGLQYTSEVTAIPHDTRFIPDLENPKKRIAGQQTALVTGPAGEEIYTDQYGRVKVQFHWDREGKWDDRTTCWIRVSQGLSGSQYGGVILPRVGQEVIVSFLEGDPDRPIITGRTYNAANMPPYSLPEHKTRMLLRSKTMHGEGYNEIRFEDLKGAEQIYMHGQLDMDTIIERDTRFWTKRDRHEHIGGDAVEDIKGCGSSQVGEDRSEGTGGKRTVSVGGDAAARIGGSWHQDVKGTIYLHGASSGVMEVDEDFTIRAPGGFIRISKSGIVIKGKVVEINDGGTPGNGVPVQAIPTRRAEFADSRDAGSGEVSTLPPPPAEVARSRPASASGAPRQFGDAALAAEPAESPQLQQLAELAPAAALPVASLLRQSAPDAEAAELADSAAVREWKRTVLDASRETAIAGKMELTDAFFDKNVSVADDSGGEAKSIAAVLESGTGSDTDIAVAKYRTLARAGVPEDSMRVLATPQGSMLAVNDGPRTLISSGKFMPVRDSAALSPGETPVAAFSVEGIFVLKAI